MASKWIVTTALYVQTMFCLLHNGDGGITIKYGVKFGNVCRSEEGRFAILFGLSIEQCVQECGLRKHCKALNFHSRLNVCELFSSDSGSDAHHGECIIVLSEDIVVIKNPCNDCVDGEVCDTTNEQCMYKECVSLNPVDNGTILGNMRNVGSKIQYKCDDGFTLTSGTSFAECTTSGIMTATAECMNDCGQPAGVTHCTVYAPVTTHGATATYTCDVEYHMTAGNSVRNCTDGLWVGTLPVCSPIPNVGCYYAGQSYLFVGPRQTTITGRNCQRWDSQSPHNHTRTNPDTFPSGDLSVNENFCRDPDNEGQPWCYTTDLNVRWEFCGIPLC